MGLTEQRGVTFPVRSDKFQVNEVRVSNGTIIESPTIYDEDDGCIATASINRIYDPLTTDSERVYLPNAVLTDLDGRIQRETTARDTTTDLEVAHHRSVGLAEELYVDRDMYL
jgi:hypothetical protein